MKSMIFISCIFREETKHYTILTVHNGEGDIETCFFYTSVSDKFDSQGVAGRKEWRRNTGATKRANESSIFTTAIIQLKNRKI